MSSIARVGTVVAAVVLLTGCAGGGGLPTPKDTQVLGTSSVNVGMCDSLFGKPSDIAKGLKLDNADKFSWWTDKITGTASRPLTCVAADAPLTMSVSLMVNKGDVKCASPSVCGAPANGVWAQLTLERNSRTDHYPTAADPDAASKWLTEAATHVK